MSASIPSATFASSMPNLPKPDEQVYDKIANKPSNYGIGSVAYAPKKVIPQTSLNALKALSTKNN